MGPQVGLAQWGPWLGRVGLWGAGDQPCCGITGAGADGPGGRNGVLGPGKVGGSPGGWAAAVRPLSVLRALTLLWSQGYLAKMNKVSTFS